MIFGINLIIGSITNPRLRMYSQKGYNMPCITERISRDRFLLLRNVFHLVDTTQPPPEHEKTILWKVQPIIDAVRNVCLQLPRDNVRYSVDEQMIPFTGRCPMRQFVKNKPSPVGLKKLCNHCIQWVSVGFFYLPRIINKTCKP